MRHHSTYVALAALAPAMLGAQSAADLVLVNGKIYTVDNTRPVVSALAVRGGRILFVGSDAEARTLANGATSVIDLHGATVLPGFVDAHAHLLGLGNRLQRVNVAGSTSYGEVIERVKAWSKDVKPGQWILGRGWDQNRWQSKDFPTHDALSRAFPNNPVAITRVDGHALLANAKAMGVAHVTAGTTDPEGGRIIRLASGLPSGVFIDNAQNLIGRAIPASTPSDIRKAVLAAIAECNRWGLTGVHDPGEDAETIGIYEDLAKEGKYNLRNYVMLSDPGEPGSAATLRNPYLVRGPQSALYDGHLWVREALHCWHLMLTSPRTQGCSSPGRSTSKPGLKRGCVAASR